MKYMLEVNGQMTFLDSVIIPIEEMLIWKRMEKISRLDKVTNEEVLR